VSSMKMVGGGILQIRNCLGAPAGGAPFPVPPGYRGYPCGDYALTGGPVKPLAGIPRPQSRSGSSILSAGGAGTDGRIPDRNRAFTQYTGTQPIYFGCLSGDVALHPGPSGDASVARWTAPAIIGSLTNVIVQGQFLPGDAGIMQVGIFINGIPQISTPYWHATDSGTFNFTLPVSTGDTIDFAVYGACGSGTTPLRATIQAIPEPSTFMLLGIGAAVYALRRTRRAQHLTLQPGSCSVFHGWGVGLQRVVPAG